MTRSDISRRLRPYRRVLVLAAEGALERASKKGGDDADPPSRTQFSRLVNLCGEATCAEELENYLRYQAGRKSSDGWKRGFVDIVVEAVHEVLDKGLDLDGLAEEERDLARVEAWRLFATYLARAQTYREAINKSERQGARHGH